MEKCLILPLRKCRAHNFKMSSEPHTAPLCVTVFPERFSPGPVQCGQYHDVLLNSGAWHNTPALPLACLTFPQREPRRKCFGTGWGRVSGNARTRQTPLPDGAAQAASPRAVREKEIGRA